MVKENEIVSNSKGGRTRSVKQRRGRGFGKRYGRGSGNTSRLKVLTTEDYESGGMTSNHVYADIPPQEIAACSTIFQRIRHGS